MRKVVILVVSILMTTQLIGQENMTGIEKGDVMKLGPVSAAGYQHIDFPRKNIIIKRGAIANFNSLVGEKVIVQNMEKDRSGTYIATLTRKDGLNFFRFFPEVKANISKALESGELKTTRHIDKNSIAHR